MSSGKSSPEMELWQAAHPLDFAWFGFAPDRLKEQYRDAGGNEHRTLGLRRVMEMETLAQLAHGELQAYGFRVHPDLSEGVVEISQFLFEAHDTEVDWDKSTVSGFGRRFEGVKAGTASSATSPAQRDELPENHSPLPIGGKGKGGRRDTFPQSAHVLRRLFQIDGNRHLSADRLHPAFKDEFGRQFAAIPAPSIRTLREQLKRFRQESEETGNNQTAG